MNKFLLYNLDTSNLTYDGDNMLINDHLLTTECDECGEYATIHIIDNSKNNNMYIYDISICEYADKGTFVCYGICIYDSSTQKWTVDNTINGVLKDKYNDNFNISLKMFKNILKRE